MSQEEFSAWTEFTRRDGMSSSLKSLRRTVKGSLRGKRSRRASLVLDAVKGSHSSCLMEGRLFGFYVWRTSDDQERRAVEVRGLPRRDSGRSWEVRGA